MYVCITQFISFHKQTHAVSIYQLSQANTCSITYYTYTQMHITGALKTLESTGIASEHLKHCLSESNIYLTYLLHI